MHLLKPQTPWVLLDSSPFLIPHNHYFNEPCHVCLCNRALCFPPIPKPSPFLPWTTSKAPPLLLLSPCFQYNLHRLARGISLNINHILPLDCSKSFMLPTSPGTGSEVLIMVSIRPCICTSAHLTGFCSIQVTLRDYFHIYYGRTDRLICGAISVFISTSVLCSKGSGLLFSRFITCKAL